MSEAHLGRYCREFDLRYDTRTTSNGGRSAVILKGMGGKRLTYRRVDKLPAENGRAGRSDWHTAEALDTLAGAPLATGSGTLSPPGSLNEHVQESKCREHRKAGSRGGTDQPAPRS